MVRTTVRRSRQKARRFIPDGPAGLDEEISAAELAERMSFEGPGARVLTEPELTAETGEAATEVMEPSAEASNKKGPYKPPTEETLSSLKTVDGQSTLDRSARVQAFVDRWRKKK
jgi:hypothetical protein